MVAVSYDYEVDGKTVTFVGLPDEKAAYEDAEKNFGPGGKLIPRGRFPEEK